MKIENRNSCEETQQTGIQKSYNKRAFDGGKSDWLSLSADEQLDRILTSMERKRKLKEHGKDYEEHDENDTPKEKEDKILWNVSRLLEQRRLKKKNGMKLLPSLSIEYKETWIAT